jgi:hypothetical protein
MHMLQNHRSFGSFTGTDTAVALAPICLGQSSHHVGQTRSELDAGGSQ